MIKSSRVAAVLAILTVIVLSIGVFYAMNARTVTGQITASNANSGESDSVKNAIEKEVSAYFYDSETKCPVDGELSINGEKAGSTKEGLINLRESKLVSGSELLIEGATGNCFNINKNISFSRTIIFRSNNTRGSLMEFPMNIIPRWPSSYKDMQFFIRPEGAKLKLNDFNLDSGTLTENIDKIANYRISYLDDSNLFSKEDYWQTPAETISNKIGDCEDWATATLSLIRAYKPDAQCYNVVWENHVSVFCYIDSTFIIYDRDKTKIPVKIEENPNSEYITEQENKLKLRAMLNNYFDDYGLRPGERRLYALFNDHEIIEFGSNEEFIDWIIGL